MELGKGGDRKRVEGEVGSGQNSSSYEEVTITRPPRWSADDLSRLPFSIAATAWKKHMEPHSNHHSLPNSRASLCLIYLAWFFVINMARLPPARTSAPEVPHLAHGQKIRIEPVRAGA